MITLKSESSIDTFAYLYQTNFDPTSPFGYLVAYDDESNGNGQFQLSFSLSGGEVYYLVVTTKNPDVTGSFRVISGALASTVLLIPSGILLFHFYCSEILPDTYIIFL